MTTELKAGEKPADEEMALHEKKALEEGMHRMVCGVEEEFGPGMDLASVRRVSRQLSHQLSDAELMESFDVAEAGFDSGPVLEAGDG